MRNTLQADTPYYRDHFDAYNARHALVDPSHTFSYDPKNKINRDYRNYTMKPNDKPVRKLTDMRRETVDPQAKNIIRLKDNQFND